MLRIRAVVAALVVAAAVFVLRRWGVLHGMAAVILAVLLVVALPWSAQLSRRILLAGAIFLGWMPLLWWVRLPIEAVDRVGLVLALASGGLVGWVLWVPDYRMRARRLVPEVAVVDAMPLVAAVVAVWTTWPLLASPGGDRTLNLLMKSYWDQVGHFSMVLLVRTQGAIVPMLGSAPDGSPWFWRFYPEHFHATAAALTELVSGPIVGDAAMEVLRYGRSLALLQVLIAVLLAAGVAQLPRLRRCALAAWPLAALIVGAFLFGPGSVALNGYPNFVLACTTVGLATLLALPMVRELVPLRVFALGGLIVATVHGWALLAPLAVIAGCLAIVPFRRECWPRTRRGSLTIILALLATVAASAAAVPLLESAGGVGRLAAPTFYYPFTVSDFLFAGGLAIAVALAAYVRGRDTESAMKGLLLAALPAAGLLMLGLLAAYQLTTAGELSYYFGKLALGVTLIFVVALAAGAALQVGPPPPRRTSARRSAAVIAAIAATFAAFQLFGYAGLSYRTHAKVLTGTPTSESQRLLHAAAIGKTRPFASTVYVAAMAGDPVPLLADSWQRALSTTWSERSDLANPTLESITAYDSVQQAADVARQLLEDDPQRAVVVAPEIANDVRGLLPAELRSRVLTW